MTVLGAPDPLSGQTPADLELGAVTARHDQHMTALKAVATQDWKKIPTTGARPTRTAQRKARTNG